jgi:hypothetical protein
VVVILAVPLPERTPKPFKELVPFIVRPELPLKRPKPLTLPVALTTYDPEPVIAPLFCIASNKLNYSQL